MVSKNRFRYRVSTVSVERIVSQDQSWTFISELSQGISDRKIVLKWDAEVTITLHSGCPANGYTVSLRLWKPNIDWDMTKCRLRIHSRIWYLLFNPLESGFWYFLFSYIVHDLSVLKWYLHSKQIISSINVLKNNIVNHVVRSI